MLSTICAVVVLLTVFQGLLYCAMWITGQPVAAITAKELKEQRSELHTKMDELRTSVADDAYEWKSEDEQAWKRMHEEEKQLNSRIEILDSDETITQRQKDAKSKQEEARQLLRDANQPEKPQQNRELRAGDIDRGINAFCRSEFGFEVDENDEQAQKRSFDAGKLNRRGKELVIVLDDHRSIRGMARGMRYDRGHDAAEARALATDPGAQGGFTISEGFIPQLERNMLHYGPMLQVAHILRTTQGNDLPWPTVDDTGNVGEIVGESASVETEAEPTFDAMVLQAYKYSSKMVKVPVELLEDSEFDIAALLADMIGERLGRKQNSDFTVGTGTNQPNGIVTASTLGVTAASATAITADEVIDLEHSVDIAYRRDAAYMLHDSILAAVRKLKDGDGTRLYSFERGAPNLINGRPYQVNNDMAGALTAGLKVMLFGQLGKYKVRQVREIRLRRLVELYAGNDQEGFVAFVRSDGDLLNAGTGPVKHLITG